MLGTFDNCHHFVAEPAATGGRALCPGHLCPAGYLAIDRAWLLVTRLSLVERGAFLAVVQRWSKHLARNDLGPTATRLRTFSVATVVELADFTVHRTWLLAACNFTVDWRAALASSTRLRDDLPYLLHFTATAFLGTGAAVAPLANHAVDRARVGVAGLHFVQLGARLPTVLRVDLDFAGHWLLPRPASLGASRILGLLPGADGTVDGAWLQLTGLRFTESCFGASFTAKLSYREQLAGTKLGPFATACVVGARFPVRPHADFAIDRARLLVAFFLLFRPVIQARLATMKASNGLNPRSLLLAFTTLGIAFAPVAPVTHLAVHWTGLLGALELPPQLRALLTVMSYVRNNGSGLSLHPTAAIGGAVSFVFPLGNLTVHRARLLIASDCPVQVGTTRCTTELCLSCDRPHLLLLSLSA
jgi:hypothetical protein